jgi:hypothetical protein
MELLLFYLWCQLGFAGLQLKSWLETIAHIVRRVKRPTVVILQRVGAEHKNGNFEYSYLSRLRFSSSIIIEFRNILYKTFECAAVSFASRVLAFHLFQYFCVSFHTGLVDLGSVLHWFLNFFFLRRRPADLTKPPIPFPFSVFLIVRVSYKNRRTYLLKSKGNLKY